MSEPQERDVERPADIATRIITRLRVPLLVVLAAAMVVLIVTLVVSDRRQSLLESSTVLIEEVQERYARWLTASAEERSRLDDELLPQLELLADRHSSRYAGRRALQLLATRHVELEEWQQAADRFTELADLATGYLAPLALSNAAVAYEELGDRDRAMSVYLDLIERYPDDLAAARALFSVGRLQEEQGDPVAAGETYAELESAYAGSRWSLLARNRLIYLRATGALDGS